MSGKEQSGRLISIAIGVITSIGVFWGLKWNLLLHPQTQLRLPYFHLAWPALLLAAGLPLICFLMSKLELSNWRLWLAFVFLGVLLMFLAIVAGHIWSGSMREILAIPFLDLLMIFGGLMLIAGFKLNALNSYFCLIAILLAAETWRRRV